MILGECGKERCSGLFGSVRMRDARVGAVDGGFCGKFSLAGSKGRASSVLLVTVGFGCAVLDNLVMVLAVFCGSAGPRFESPVHGAVEAWKSKGRKHRGLDSCSTICAHVN